MDEQSRAACCLPLAQFLPGNSDTCRSFSTPGHGGLAGPVHVMRPSPLLPSSPPTFVRAGRILLLLLLASPARRPSLPRHKLPRDPAASSSSFLPARSNQGTPGAAAARPATRAACVALDRCSLRTLLSDAPRDGSGALIFFSNN